MLTKAFLSPFFAPLIFLLLWLGVVSGIYGFVAEDDILQQTVDGKLIDIVAKCGYLLLLVVLFTFADDYKDKMRSWGLYIFFTLICFLRESGIQHHLSTTDTTPFKSRFFLNPENPLYEKVIYGIILLLILFGVLYLARKYAKHLIRSFLKFDTVAWSIATLCTTGIASKVIDRFPANYHDINGGRLSENVYIFLQVLEETGEMFLPYLAMLALWQYHLSVKKR